MIKLKMMMMMMIIIMIIIKKKDECDNDIYLEINGLTENNEEIEMPLFKYHYK